MKLFWNCHLYNDSFWGKYHYKNSNMWVNDIFGSVKFSEINGIDQVKPDEKLIIIDSEFVKLFSEAVRAGAVVLNVPDTVGYTTPDEMYELINRLMNEVYQADKVIFSVHCHNDLGMGVANS